MDTLLRDLRHAVTRLRREPTFSGTVLLTLALCVGANVAIFSVVHAVLLAPLPFAEPDRIVTVFNSYPGAGAVRGSNGVVDFFERRENVPAFEEVALWQPAGRTVGEAGSTERMDVLRVTPSFFSLVRVNAALGRTFTEAEMEVGNDLKVVLTHGYWQDRFAGSRDVLSRTLRVDGRAYEIVGVLPEDFRMPGVEPPRFLLPLAFGSDARAIDNWHSNSFQMYARLAPGVSVEQARAQNAALNERLVDGWPLPNARQLLEDVGYSTQVHPAQADLVRDVAPVLYLLWAGVGFVLLIGCVNIANLMLARAHGRASEVATQLALGAARSRIGRQVLTEALVMAVAGSALGTGMGVVGLRVIRALGTDALPAGVQIGVEAPVLLFTVALALGAGVLFGALPVLQVFRSDLSPVFRAEGRGGTASRGAVTLRNALVVGQVALAFVLLIGAGLMLASFRAAVRVDPGFESDGVFTAFVSLPSVRYERAADQIRFWDELRSELEALPTVSAAGLTSQLPFTASDNNSVITPEGYVPRPGESLLSPAMSMVSPGYFEAMGIEVVEGRTLRDSDRRGELNVIVIDRWLAERYWPDSSPLGRRMAFGVPPGADSIPEDQLYTIVGVVESVKQRDLTAPAAEFVGAYYLPLAQLSTSFVTVVARAAEGDASGLTSDVRSVLGRLDPELPLFGVETMEARIDASLARRKVPLVMLGVFAAVALFLAVVGIYGSLAYTVSQRTREIGVRMALGSAPDHIFRTVVGQGLRVTGLGLAVGAAASWFLSRLIQSLLFGVQATDVRVTLAVAVVLAVVGGVACILPARRATRVDPVVALGG